MIMIRNNFKKYKVADSPTYMSAKTSAKNFKNHFSQKKYYMDMMEIIVNNF